MIVRSFPGHPKTALLGREKWNKQKLGAPAGKQNNHWRTRLLFYPKAFWVDCRDHGWVAHMTGTMAGNWSSLGCRLRPVGKLNPRQNCLKFKKTCRKHERAFCNKYCRFWFFTLANKQRNAFKNDPKTFQLQRLSKCLSLPTAGCCGSAGLPGHEERWENLSRSSTILEDSLRKSSRKFVPKRNLFLLNIKYVKPSADTSWRHVFFKKVHRSSPLPVAAGVAAGAPVIISLPTQKYDLHKSLVQQNSYIWLVATMSKRFHPILLKRIRIHSESMKFTKLRWIMGSGHDPPNVPKSQTSGKALSRFAPLPAVPDTFDRRLRLFSGSLPKQSSNRF